MAVVMQSRVSGRQCTLGISSALAVSLEAACTVRVDWTRE